MFCFLSFYFFFSFSTFVVCFQSSVCGVGRGAYTIIDCTSTVSGRLGWMFGLDGLAVYTMGRRQHHLYVWVTKWKTFAATTSNAKTKIPHFSPLLDKSRRRRRCRPTKCEVRQRKLAHSMRMECETLLPQRILRGILAIPKIIRTGEVWVIRRLHIQPVRWKVYPALPVQVSIVVVVPPVVVV